MTIVLLEIVLYGFPRCVIFLLLLVSLIPFLFVDDVDKVDSPCCDLATTLLLFVNLSPVNNGMVALNQHVDALNVP